MYTPHSRLAEASNKPAWQDLSRKVTHPDVSIAPSLTPQSTAGLFFLTIPYSQLREAASGRNCQNPGMKNLLTAGLVLLAGVALLQIIPEADLLPAGVRSVLNSIRPAE
jgi:hypothetical protein